jgi:hypothetical protein
MYGTGLVSGVDDAAVELHRSLQAQARELDAVLARFTEARALLPRHSDDGWRGFAHFVYGLKLDELGSELARLHEHLSSALQQTRRAVGTLGNRVG